MQPPSPDVTTKAFPRGLYSVPRVVDLFQPNAPQKDLEKANIGISAAAPLRPRPVTLGSNIVHATFPPGEPLPTRTTIVSTMVPQSLVNRATSAVSYCSRSEGMTISS